MTSVTVELPITQRNSTPSNMNTMGRVPIMYPNLSHPFPYPPPFPYDPLIESYHNETNFPELFLNAYNTYNASVYYYNFCPSIQKPVNSFILMVLYALVCLIGMFGNLLVIYVVLRFSKMQTVTNTYILNLALADLCFLIGIPFLLITMHLGEWSFGTGMCKVYMVSTSTTQFTSSLLLCIMSADRFIAVCYPVASPRYRSPFIAKVVSSLAWFASALIMLPVMLYATTIEKEDNKVTCNIEWPQDNETGSGKTFTIYSLVLGFAIPLCLILTFYFLVIRRLRTVGPKTKSKEKRRSHRKVTVLVLTVISVYVICWSPHWISQVALITSPPDMCNTRLEITLFVLVGCLPYLNSAVNPILYAFLSDNFKKSFLKAFTCAFGKDFNAQLQLENSIFPRFGKRKSEKFCSTTKTGGGGIPIDSNNPITITENNRQIQISNDIEFKSIIEHEKSFNDAAKGQAVGISGPKSQIFVSSSSCTLNNYNCFTFGERPPILHSDL